MFLKKKYGESRSKKVRILLGSVDSFSEVASRQREFIHFRAHEIEIRLHLQYALQSFDPHMGFLGADDSLS